MAKLKEKEGTKGTDGELSEVEKTFFQPEYHVMLGTFDDFAEMMIQVRVTSNEEHNLQGCCFSIAFF